MNFLATLLIVLFARQEVSPKPEELAKELAKRGVRISKIQDRLENYWSIDLMAFEGVFSDDDISLLKPFKKIKTVSFYLTRVTDKGIVELLQNKHLIEDITISSTTTKKSFAVLAQIDGLRSLSLTSFSKNDGDLSGISTIKNLKSLRLYNAIVGSMDAREICSLSHLERIELHDSKISDEFFLQIKNLEELRVLNLPFSNPGNKAISLLRKNTKLTEVNLDRAWAITDFSSLYGMRQLTRLYVSGTRFQDEDLSRMDCLEGVVAMGLSDCKCTNRCLTLLSKCENLEELILDGLSIRDDDIPMLKRMRKLSCLHLGRTNVSNKGIAELAKITTLKELGFNQSRNVDRQSVKHLVSLTGLEKLDLSSTFVGDDAVDDFKPLRNLKFLDVSDTKITADGAFLLRRVLPNTTIKAGRNVPEKKS